MHPETVNLLRSPYRHEQLELITQADGSEALRGKETGSSYPIKNAITNLLLQERVEGYNKKYQKFYNFAAPLYDATLNLGAKLARKSVDQIRMQYIEKLEFKENSRFLEVSIGTAANIKYIPDNVQCYGIDISPGMLKRGQKNLARWHRQVELFLGDAEELPFIDDVFDSVLHVGGINAFSNREQAIAEMIRVAKPGSKIVIVDESAKLISRLSWFPGARKMLKTHAEVFSAPVKLLPDSVSEIEVSEVMGGDLYCLSFRC